MKKKMLLAALVTVVSFALTANSAWAGSAQRNRLKGIAIGLSAAAIIGSIISSSHEDHYVRSHNNCHIEPRRVGPPVHNRYKNREEGHWVIKREWVPPECREVWNPAHYNPGGEWVEGQWIRIVEKPGYWTEKRIWVTEVRRPGKSRYTKSVYY